MRSPICSWAWSKCIPIAPLRASGRASGRWSWIEIWLARTRRSATASFTSASAEETEGHIQEALRLSPRDTHVYLWCMFAGLAKFRLGREEEAVAWLRRSVEANRNYPSSRFILAAALARLGRLPEARSEVERNSPSTRLSPSPDFAPACSAKIRLWPLGGSAMRRPACGRGAGGMARRVVASEAWRSSVSAAESHRREPFRNCKPQRKRCDRHGTSRLARDDTKRAARPVPTPPRAPASAGRPSRPSRKNPWIRSARRAARCGRWRRRCPKGPPAPGGNGFRAWPRARSAA